MFQDDTFQLLAVSARPAVVNRLLSELRAQAPVRLETLSDAEQLRHCLGEGHWQALVCFEEDGLALSPADTLRLWEDSGRPLPLLLVQAPDSAEDSRLWLSRGAADVLAPGEAAKLPWRLLREGEAERQRRAARRSALASAELGARVGRLLETATEGLAYLRDGLHLYCNPAYAAAFGYPDPAAIRSLPLLDLVAAADRPALRQALLQAGDAEQSLTLDGLDPSGATRPLQLILAPTDFEGHSCLELRVTAASGAIGQARAPAQAAELDLLTRLHTPAFFLRRIEAAIAAAVREGRDSMLLVVRLQDFPDLASSLGHGQANRILGDISEQLRASLSANFCAARLDSQEFGLLLPGVGPDEALRLMEGIRARIDARLAEAAQPGQRPGSAAGLGQINRHAHDAQDCLGRARANLEAGLLAPGDYRHAAAPNLDALLAYLNEALTPGQLRLLFQPLVDLQGSPFRGYEVFARLLDSEGKEMPPAAFLPALALAGRGEDFDRLVVEAVLALLARHPAPFVTLALKLTSDSLQSSGFLPWLSEALAAQPGAREGLLPQISEMDLHRNPERVLATCDGLGELGLRKSLIHFGCALEPFRHLEAFAPWLVVLDSSLLRDLGYHPEQRRRLQTLINDLHSLGCLVGVPRVEDLDQLPLLWELGVDVVQGSGLQSPSREMDYEFAQEAELSLTAAPAP